MKKVYKKDIPVLFEGIGEMIIEDSYSQHRRGSNFFTQSIVKFDEKDAKYYPTVENFAQYCGTWETNTYIKDTEYGTEWIEITELTKVEKKEKVITATVWVPID